MCTTTWAIAQWQQVATYRLASKYSSFAKKVVILLINYYDHCGNLWQKDYYSERKESCNDDNDVKYNDDYSVCAHTSTLFHALL